jgi:hypothetical protein
MTDALRYWHTLRHLKPVQIYGRLWFRLHRPRPDLRPPPALRRAERAWVRCARHPSMPGPATFRFLSVGREASAADDWNRPDWPKLWLYNLHYFDDLNADAAAARVAWHRALVSRWVAENPPATGTGWEPYLRAEAGAAVLLADVGEIGPDYLPGHAHGDTLSFELSVFGQRVVVNSGTSEYGLGAERLRQRGTEAHSTVQIDDADSSEVWSGFRVARRARPLGRMLDEVDGAVILGCAHDGYLRLPGRPLHRREWRLTPGGLRITDRIEGGCCRAVARFHLHPAITVHGDGVLGELELSDGHRIRWSASGGAVRIVGSTWHPEFGQSVAGHCIELELEGPHAVMEFAWA